MGRVKSASKKISYRGREERGVPRGKGEGGKPFPLESAPRVKFSEVVLQAVCKL